MSPSLMVGLEGLLVFGSVLGLAVYEVLRLRRDRRKPAEPAVDISLPDAVSASVSRTIHTSTTKTADD